MSFTDKDKRILIEVINHIHNAYSSDQAFKESESTSITLPARLVRLSADVVEQTYRPGIINSLDKPEVELLVTSLFKSIDSMRGSLAAVLAAFPEELSDRVRNQFDEQLKNIEALNGGSQPASSPRGLIESGEDTSVDHLQPDELRQRHRELSDTQQDLSEVDLDKLREEVIQLEAEIGPRQRELEELQRSVAVKTAELDNLTSAIAAAENMIASHDVRVRDQLERMLSLAGNLVTALNPHLSSCERQIREAVQTVAEKVSEGARLKADLVARINEISAVLEETARISSVLSLYKDANHRLIRSIPTVVTVTKEKLIRVDEQLRDIDSDLKQALAQHQSARHVAEVARV